MIVSSWRLNVASVTALPHHEWALCYEETQQGPCSEIPSPLHFTRLRQHDFTLCYSLSHWLHMELESCLEQLHGVKDGPCDLLHDSSGGFWPLWDKQLICSNWNELRSPSPPLLNTPPSHHIKGAWVDLTVGSIALLEQDLPCDFGFPSSRTSSLDCWEEQWVSLGHVLQVLPLTTLNLCWALPPC